jgi:hypothetical protein
MVRLLFFFVFSGEQNSTSGFLHKARPLSSETDKDKEIVFFLVRI